LPVSFSSFSLLVTLSFVAQAVLTYFLLRLLRLPLWFAIVGLFFAVWMAHFHPFRGTVFPDISPIRLGYGLVLLFWLALRLRFAPANTVLRVLEYLLMALASLWSLEIFVMTAIAYIGARGYQ